MNLQISKTVVIAGVLTMSLFSCSKESTGKVLSISESFENQEPDDTANSSATTYEEEVLAIQPGHFKTNLDNDALTATFERLFANGEDFMWSFPEATPASSTEANPGEITYPSAGEYTVTLEVTIDDESYMHSETITFE